MDMISINSQGLLMLVYALICLIISLSGVVLMSFATMLGQPTLQMLSMNDSCESLHPNHTTPGLLYRVLSISRCHLKRMELLSVGRIMICYRTHLLSTGHRARSHS